MLYAVIQEEYKEFDPVPVSDVFSEVFDLNKIDAYNKVVNSSFGIPAFGLESFTADHLIQKLLKLGIKCKKLKMESLLPLPDSYPVYSAAFSGDGISFENFHNERNRILWNHINLVEVYRIHSKTISIQGRKIAKRIGKPSTVTIRKEAVKDGKYIEIFSDSPFPRLLIDTSRFNYSGLGENMNKDSQCNLEQLLSIIQKSCDRYRVIYNNSISHQTFQNARSYELFAHWHLQIIN